MELIASLKTIQLAIKILESSAIPKIKVNVKLITIHKIALQVMG